MSNTARERTLQTISDLEYRDFDGVAAFDTDEWTDAICDIWQPLLKDAHDLLELSTRTAWRTMNTTVWRWSRMPYRPTELRPGYFGEVVTSHRNSEGELVTIERVAPSKQFAGALLLCLYDDDSPNVAPMLLDRGTADWLSSAVLALDPVS